MKKQLIVALGSLALVFSLGGPAGAVVNFADDDCASPDSTIDTAAEAVRVANGYNCPLVDLVIKTSLSDNAPSDIVDVEVSIRAKTITIEGPDVLDINKRVQIINDLADSKLFLTAAGGNMSITEGSIKAHKELKLECEPLNCDIIVRDSDLIAALDFVDPQGGGSLRIDAGRNFDSQRSSVHGGDFLEIDAANGSITLKCKPGEGGCKDPLISGKDVELCDTDQDGVADYPCDVTFADAKELRAVCIQSPGVKCNGGHKEKRFTAKTDIDITDSKITSVEHMTFTAKDGEIKASGAELSAEAIVMTAKKQINISKAIIKTSVGETKITAGAGCPALSTLPAFPAGTCINGREADIEGINVLMTANSGNGRIDVCGATITDLGSDKPTFNGDTTPPFSRVVGGFETIIDDAGECPAVPGAAVID